MEKTHGKGVLKFAILTTIAIAQADTIASVMLSDIAAAFPDASTMAVQYVMQSAMIGAFAVSLLMSVLTAHFRKKPMILAGLVCMFLGGFIPLVNHSSIAILDFCGFLVGAGQGFLVPLLGALVLESFKGKERQRMIGLNTTFLTGGAALLLLLAGPICLTGWTNVYFIYLIAAPVFLIALLFLPKEEKPAAKAKAERTFSGRKVAAIPPMGWIQCALIVLMSVAYAVFPLNLSFLVTANGFGDAASVSVGMTTITVVSALVGLVLPQLIRMSKLFLCTLGSAFGLAAALVVMFAQNMGMVYVGTVLAGIFFGINMASPGYYVSRICTPAQYGPTYSLATSVNYLGIILSPVILQLHHGRLGRRPGGGSERVRHGRGHVRPGVGAEHRVERLPDAEAARRRACRRAGRRLPGAGRRGSRRAGIGGGTRSLAFARPDVDDKGRPRPLRAQA